MVERVGVASSGAVEARSWRARLLVPTLVLAGSLMAVVSSLGAPLIPTIARSDSVSLSTAQWLLTITLMTGALATPVMGRLADGPRQRDVILVALSAVVVGCALAAVSSDFGVLIVGRALQGVGLGLVPVAMAIARRNLAPDKARRTIATLSITTVLGVGLGYPLTGLIAEITDFRGAYWFGAITVSAALVLATVVLPSRSPSASRPFDLVGAVTLSLMIVGVTVVLSEGGAWGWTTARSLGTIVGFLILLGFWVPYELHRGDPLIDLRQVRNRSVLMADVAGFIISIAMYLVVPVMVEFVQVPRAAGYGFGASVVVSGLVLTPLSIGTYVASRCLVGYERRFGSRSMIPLGALVFGAAAGFFALEHSALWEAFLTAGISGFGIGFSTGAMPGFIVRAVPQGETGSATSFYQVLRSIGLTVGSALGAALLSAHTAPGHTLPAVEGFRVALLIAAALAVATLVVSYCLPGRVADQRPPRPGGVGRPVLDQQAPEQQQTLDQQVLAQRMLDDQMTQDAELASAGVTVSDDRTPLEQEDHRR